MKTSLYNRAFSFWLDFLEVYATLLNEEYFENLATHSNWKMYHKYFGNFDCRYKKTNNFAYMIIFYDNNRPMFSYFKGKKDNKVPTKDYVVFYSAVFRKYWPKFVVHFLYENFIFSQNSIRRFDIYTDFNEDIEKILEKFYFRPQKTATFTNEKGRVESFYIGQVQNTKKQKKPDSNLW